MTSERIQALIAEADNLPLGSLQVPLLEEAANLADRLQDEEQGFAARHRLIYATWFAGSLDRSVVAFSWCLAYLDRHPNVGADDLVLDSYRVVISALPDFVTLSLAQIDAAVDDLEARLQAKGRSPRTAANCRWLVLVRTGRLAAAHDIAKSSRTFSKDALWDDDDFEAVLEAYDAVYRQDRSKLETRLDHWLSHFWHEPVVRSSVLSLLLRVMVEQGRAKQARALFERVRRDVCQHALLIEQLGYLLIFAAGWAGPRQLRRLLEQAVQDAWQSCDHLGRLHVYLGGELVCRRWAMGSPGRRRKLRLPADFPLTTPDGWYELPVLQAWFRSECEQLMARFDARNGNSFFTNFISQWRSDVERQQDAGRADGDKETLPIDDPAA